VVEMADDLDDLLDEFDEMMGVKDAPKAVAPAPAPTPAPAPAGASTAAARKPPASDAFASSSPSSPLGGGQGGEGRGQAADDAADMDALLNDFDLDLGSPPPVARPAAAAKKKEVDVPVAKAKAAQKCLSCFLGGSSDSFLSASSRRSDRKCCDKMMCVKCNFAVAHFNDVKWHGSCDYLFFRAANTDGKMLKSKMVPAPGHRAYCCQCLWTDAAKLVEISKDPSVSGKWVCQRQHR